MCTMFCRECKLFVECLEQERAHSSHLSLLLHEDLKVLVDDSDGQQDTGATADSAYNDSQLVSYHAHTTSYSTGEIPINFRLFKAI